MWARFMFRMCNLKLLNITKKVEYKYRCINLFKNKYIFCEFCFKTT